MREVRGRTAEIRSQLRELRDEIKEILTATEFNEDLFLEKTKTVRELQRMKYEAMEDAIVKLAQQFTQEERLILAQMLPLKGGHRGSRPFR
jgi:uncharacterized membrane protein